MGGNMVRPDVETVNGIPYTSEDGETIMVGAYSRIFFQGKLYVACLVHANEDGKLIQSWNLALGAECAWDDDDLEFAADPIYTGESLEDCITWLIAQVTY